ncbi:MAG: UDP-3-O-(3-hydroxymyristoyl)glucosamine N-acyltransferase, partial [Pseudomonadota bacterium]
MAFRPLCFSGEVNFMPDARFFLTSGPISVDEALRLAGVEGAASSVDQHLVRHASSVDDPDLEGALLFVEDEARAKALRPERFALCFATPELKTCLDGASGVVSYVQSPRAAFASVAGRLHALRGLSDAGSPADVDQTAAAHPTALIGPGAKIGPRVDIGPHAIIGPGVVVGAGSSIAENASVWCALLGTGVKIGAGSVIGGPGFGFAAGPAGVRRIPQLGRVIIGDSAEIGGNACVDRGALGDTVIGPGTKIDNLVQIAHNVRIGENCLIASQVGIAGSAIIGRRVQFGGQAGIADHVTIGDDARIA